MKLWIELAVCTVMVATIVTLSVLCRAQKRHLKALETQVKEQSAVIDSLVANPALNYEVKLVVTDKTKTYVYGRYNKGTINVPSQKTYVLEIDSTSIKLK